MPVEILHSATSRRDALAVAGRQSVNRAEHNTERQHAGERSPLATRRDGRKIGRQGGMNSGLQAHQKIKDV